MKYFRLVVVLIAALPLLVRAEFTSHRIMLSSILPDAGASDWVLIDPLQFPAEFQETHPLVENRSFVTGYRLHDNRSTMVFVEIEKPYLDGKRQFCRSRISVYYFFGYKPDVEFSEQTRLSVVDRGEFLNFDQKNILADCGIQALNGLNDYIYSDSEYGDDFLVAVGEIVLTEAAAGGKVLSIETSRSRNSSKSSEVYIHIQKEDGDIVSKALRSCAQISLIASEIPTVGQVD